MTRKHYKGKSLKSAERQVNQARKLADEWKKLAEAFDAERKMLARLAAEGPAFDNPLIVFHAKELRNRILSSMGMNPDGSFKSQGAS